MDAPLRRAGRYGEQVFRRWRATDDGGWGMVATAISLLITALLVLISLTTFLKPGSGPASVNNAPGVGMADDLQAQNTLNTSLTAAESTAIAGGGYGSVTASALSASNPSITYVDGPSNGPTTVSVATSSNGDGSGGVTMAAWSSSHNCWLVWKGDGGASWYGEQTGLTSCTAPALSAAPTASSVSSSTIGWRLGAFPA